MVLEQKDFKYLIRSLLKTGTVHIFFFSSTVSAYLLIPLLIPDQLVELAVTWNLPAATV